MYVHLRSEDGSVWLTQMEIADLFASTKQNIGKHTKNILEEGELLEHAVVKENFTTAIDGKRHRTMSSKYTLFYLYYLDVSHKDRHK